MRSRTWALRFRSTISAPAIPRWRWSGNCRSTPSRSIARSSAKSAATREGKAIINAIIALGRALDLIVVAEGVETKEQEEFLREQKCDEEQGYLISVPLPAEEFAAFLANQTRARLRAHAAEASQRRHARPTGTLG